jgi:hypothetical protein
MRSLVGTHSPLRSLYAAKTSGVLHACASAAAQIPCFACYILLDAHKLKQCIRSEVP